MSKKLTKLSVAMTATLAAGVASASPDLIPLWDFVIDNGFTEYTGDGIGVTGSNDNVYLTTSTDTLALAGGGSVNLPFDNADTQLRWGVPSGQPSQSGLDVTPYTAGGNSTSGPGNVSGQLTTNAAPIRTFDITHLNRVIALSGGALTEATLFDVLFLKPADAPDFEQVPALAFTVLFEETLNTSENAGLCGDANPNTPCGDVFVLSAPGVDFGVGKISQDFDLLGGEYTLNIFLPDLGVLTNAQCQAAGAANGCYGFTTQEGNDTTKFISLQITGREIPIPVPGTLALMGLGLMGLGLNRRRRLPA